MTKQELIQQYKLDYPTLSKQINDEIVVLDSDEYEATIEAWADAELIKIAKAKEAETKALAETALKAALLDRLGITEDEAKLLLS